MSWSGESETYMNKLKILHIADMHMDSAFQGLGQGKAVVRRGEQRQLLSRMAELCEREHVDLVLMCGDLLDSDSSYFETGEELAASLASIKAPVFISPGNHDYYSPRSPYAKLKLPENVHIFTRNAIEKVDVKRLGVRVYGAAFTDKSSPALVKGFAAPREEGIYNILCIHGELGAAQSKYNPISEEELAGSGLDYAALGHVHKASGLRKAGDTWYSWPGCPEGRGFDELGEKYVNIVELEGGDCTLTQHCIAHRRYELLKVDVSGTEPLLAIHTMLPDETVRDVYRIVLTGETDQAPDISALEYNLSEFFFELQIKDETRIRRNVWERAGEDSLRGIFLEKLQARYAQCTSDEERLLVEQAARWGLAALDRGEEVVTHEDK